MWKWMWGGGRCSRGLGSRGGRLGSCWWGVSGVWGRERGREGGVEWGFGGEGGRERSGGAYVCPLWNFAWGGQRGLKTWVRDLRES